MSRMIKIALASLVATTLVAPSAFAQQAGRDQVSIRVAYGDLDLASAAGGQTLLHRIEGAARQVCGDRWDYSQFLPHAVSQCRHATVAATVTSLRIDMLTQAWNGKSAAAMQVATR